MNNKKISKKVFENILIAVAIMLYFIMINFAYYRVEQNILLVGLKVLSIIVLALGITILEISYRKENGELAINAVEILVLAVYTLSVAHIVEIQKFNFANYVIVSSYIFSIYYLFKAIVIFTKERRAYLKSLSDIKEIVSNEPTKKEAEKRNKKS